MFNIGRLGYAFAMSTRCDDTFEAQRAERAPGRSAAPVTSRRANDEPC
jgi:hypothetical protein